MKFRVLIGQHIKKCPNCNEGKIGADPRTAKICQLCQGGGQLVFRARPMALINPAAGAGNPTVPSSWQPSEVFEEDSDLVTMFNIPGSTKYERMPDDMPTGAVPQQVAPIPAVPMASGNPYTDYVTRLEAMTVDQLKQHADAEEINITGLKTKKEIVEAIKSRLHPTTV
jgi:hypothetical protein